MQYRHVTDPFMNTGLWINGIVEGNVLFPQAPRIEYHCCLSHIKITNKTIQAN